MKMKKLTAILTATAMTAVMLAGCGNSSGSSSSSGAGSTGGDTTSASGTEEYPGKKLGFIIQEMGREINTIGSKANDAEIQKFVIRMKDELEKIREQSVNIL